MGKVFDAAEGKCIKNNRQRLLLAFLEPEGIAWKPEPGDLDAGSMQLANSDFGTRHSPKMPTTSPNTVSNLPDMRKFI
jgi:hypothetical protein